MFNHFNELTPAEQERLVLVNEECGEVIQIISKILRHGYESYHPDNPSDSNRDLLAKELGDLQHVIERIWVDVDARDIEYAKDQKEKNVVKYLHHQPPANPVLDGEDGED